MTSLLAGDAEICVAASSQLWPPPAAWCRTGTGCGGKSGRRGRLPASLELGAAVVMLVAYVCVPKVPNSSRSSRAAMGFTSYVRAMVLWKLGGPSWRSGGWAAQAGAFAGLAGPGHDRGFSHKADVGSGGKGCEPRKGNLPGHKCLGVMTCTDSSVQQKRYVERKQRAEAWFANVGRPCCGRGLGDGAGHPKCPEGSYLHTTCRIRHHGGHTEAQGGR